MSDPILPLAVWQEGTLQNDVPANDNSLRIEAMRRPVEAIANSPSVTDDGAVYIVGAAPSGAFATFDPDDLTIYRGGTWYAWAPTEGLEVNGYQFTGSGGWVTSGGSGSGDVVGPASATADAVALFDGTTGKLLKNGAKTIANIREIEQNSQSSAYTLVLSDAGKHIFHPSADTTARIWTIPANSSVAFPIGTAVTFVNQNAAGVITIAITTDTMRLAGAGTTGSRTLAANGVATALKVTSTEWIISGTGMT